MEDAVAHVLIAAGDKDLFAGDDPSRLGFLGTAAHAREIGPGPRFCQAHGRQRFARGERRNMAGFLVLGAEPQKRAHRAGDKAGDHLEAMIGAGEDFRGDSQHQGAETLTTIGFGRCQAGPALFGIGLIYGSESIGHTHPSVFEGAALLIA